MDPILVVHPARESKQHFSLILQSFLSGDANAELSQNIPYRKASYDSIPR